jgi:hypothetical protein
MNERTWDKRETPLFAKGGAVQASAVCPDEGQADAGTAPAINEMQITTRFAVVMYCQERRCPMDLAYVVPQDASRAFIHS